MEKLNPAYKENWTVKETAQVLGIGENQVTRLVMLGHFKFFTCGNKKLINADLAREKCKTWAKLGLDIKDL